MGHRLEREATLRQAEADGWMPLPDEGLPRLGSLQDVTSSLQLTNLTARWKASHLGEMVLLLGDGGEAGPGCGVAYQGPFKTASSVIGGHFMLPVRRFEVVSPTYHLWAFVEEPGKRRRAVKSYFGKVDHALIAAARAARTLATIAVIGNPDAGGAVFLYSVPPPPGPPGGRAVPRPAG